MSKSFIDTVREKNGALKDGAVREMLVENATIEQSIKLTAQRNTAQLRAEVQAADLDAQIAAGIPQRKALAGFLSKVAVADKASAMGRKVNGEVMPPPADTTTPNGVNGTAPALNA